MAYSRLVIGRQIFDTQFELLFGIHDQELNGKYSINDLYKFNQFLNFKYGGGTRIVQYINYDQHTSFYLTILPKETTVYSINMITVPASFKSISKKLYDCEVDPMIYTISPVICPADN